MLKFKCIRNPDAIITKRTCISRLETLGRMRSPQKSLDPKNIEFCVGCTGCKIPVKKGEPKKRSSTSNNGKIIQVSGFGSKSNYMLVALTNDNRVLLSEGDGVWADVGPKTEK